MTAIFMGFLFMVIGVWGLIHWFDNFLMFLKGLLPFSVFVGGIMAFIAGIASVQARRNNGSKKN